MPGRVGQVVGAHLGHHLENPRHIDIDHHVPLKNAHISGGWRWSPERKEEYANYLGAENHLIAISARHNRSKGARGPEEWAPPDNSLWCQYATDWAEIKERWELSMTPVESEIVMDMIGTCENPPVFEVESRGRAGGRREQADCGAGEDGLRVLRGGRGSWGGTGAGKPGRRQGIPGGDGAERAGRRRGRDNM